MKKFLHSRDGASKGAALIIVLAFVVIVTALALAHFSRTTTDRQLAQSSYNDTSADLLARTALDIVNSNLKQEIVNAGAVTQFNIQPQRSGDDASIPNLIRRSVQNDAILPPGVASLASSVSSISPSANGRSISKARWNSHYLVPLLNPTGADSTPLSSFAAPDWVLITSQGPNSAPAPSDVIGRYAFAVYDEGGLLDMNLGGFPTYASLTLPTVPGRPARPTRRMAARYPSEESQIMLAACQSPNFTPDHTNEYPQTGVPYSYTPNTNHSPTSFSANFLPRGLSINPNTGTITGTPTGPGSYTVTLTCSNGCPPDGTGILNFTITGFPFAETTPWPVNLARKGTNAFADLTALPSALPFPTPTTTQINKLMGWRNYATTKQTGASFDNPSFPPDPVNYVKEELYAKYSLGDGAAFTTPFTTVSTTVQNGRTDQGVITRQELIKLQRTIGFSQSLLQYLGTFSREYNRPAASWPQLTGTLSGARWDMNNLAVVVPTSWWPGHHGQGHAYGYARRLQVAQLFGLVWHNGTFAAGTRLTDPNYYGHWEYNYQHGDVDQLPVSGDQDFFQVIDYALKRGNGGVSPTRATVFTLGAALIDQYDTDEVFDDPGGAATGNTITIIDYDGNPLNYAYGIERMSWDDPNQNLDRPPFAPNPLSLGVPANYVLLDRRFENVGEFGYAYNPVSTTPSKTLDFASSASPDKPILDFFTYNTGTKRAGIVNLNTRNGPVLASIIRGAWVHDPGSEVLPPDPTYLVSRDDALAAGQAIVQETTSNGPALTRADVARLAAAAASALHQVPGASEDEKKQTIARALAEAGQTRTWNLMIDVIAQTGQYAPGTNDLSDPSKFIVQGEKRYWLHIALDRDNGTVLGSQLEEVVE